MIRKKLTDDSLTLQIGGNEPVWSSRSNISSGINSFFFFLLFFPPVTQSVIANALFARQDREQRFFYIKKKTSGWRDKSRRTPWNFHYEPHLPLPPKLQLSASSPPKIVSRPRVNYRGGRNAGTICSDSGMFHSPGPEFLARSQKERAAQSRFPSVLPRPSSLPCLTAAIAPWPEPGPSIITTWQIIRHGGTLSRHIPFV